MKNISTNIKIYLLPIEMLCSLGHLFYLGQWTSYFFRHFILSSEPFKLPY